MHQQQQHVSHIEVEGYGGLAGEEHGAHSGLIRMNLEFFHQTNHVVLHQGEPLPSDASRGVNQQHQVQLSTAPCDNKPQTNVLNTAQAERKNKHSVLDSHQKTVHLLD